MTPQRVFVADFLRGPLEIEQAILGELAEVVALDATSEGALHGRIDDADAVMLYHTVGLSAGTIERLTRCRLIVRCGVGYDNVDLAAARARGIAVANVPDYGTEEVADSAIAMALTLARCVSFLNSRLRAGQGDWSYEQVVPTYRLRGRVFGVVGLGRIGTATALRAKALGMSVVFFDPYKPDGYDKAIGIERAETLEELLSRSYVLSLHCPLAEETRHLIDAAACARLPEGSFLVNTARGGIVDPQAVVDAIASGRLAGAGIDVLEREPADEANPLVRAWRDPQHPAHHRVLLNPHAAFYCEEGLADMRRSGALACRRALLGEPIRNLVS